MASWFIPAMTIRALKILALCTLLWLALLPTGEAASEVKYTPGGSEWAKTWTAFYNNPGSEDDLMRPLVKAGPRMTPAILEAISHKDMKQRRYAIGALGYLKDPRAMAPLVAILRDRSEEEYFRADALHAIYQLDQNRGTELAKRFGGQGDTLKIISAAILKQEPWLLGR